MALLAGLTTVRYYTAADPYHYSVDNRPLTDLAASIAFIANSIDTGPLQTTNTVIINGLTPSLIFPARTVGRGQNIISAFDNGPFSGTPDPTFLLGYGATSVGGQQIPGEPFAYFAIEGDYNDGSGQHKMEMYLQWNGLPGQASDFYRPFFSQANRTTGGYTNQIAGDVTQFINKNGTVNIMDVYGNAITGVLIYTPLSLGPYANSSSLGLSLNSVAGKYVTITPSFGPTGDPAIMTAAAYGLSLGVAGTEVMTLTSDWRIRIVNSTGVGQPSYLYRTSAVFNGTTNQATLFGYNTYLFGQIPNSADSSIMIGMEADYNDGSNHYVEFHVNLARPSGSYVRPFSAAMHRTTGVMTTDILGDTIELFGPLVTSTATEVRVTSANTTGTRLNLIDTDTGGKSWGIYSSGSGAVGGAGNLTVFNNTNNRYGMILLGGTTGGISIGTIIASVGGDLDSSSMIQVGDGGALTATRTNIRLRNGGFAAPSSENALSDGDKIVMWNAAAVFKAAIGIESGGVFFQNSGAGTTAGFKWYGGTSAPALQMQLTTAGTLAVPARITLGDITVTYSASMTPNASLGNSFIITATNGTAFTINAPTNPLQGQTTIFTIRNTSGGALGAATWNAVFKMAAWTSPATANSRSITFKYDGTNWIEITRTAADIPN